MLKSDGKKGYFVMDIILNEIIMIKDNEYKDWIICLNNANQDGIYSFDDDRDSLLSYISWKKEKMKRVVSE